MNVLKQKNTLDKFITNAETYLEPRRISTMELFGLTIFANKLHHRFSIGFYIRLCSDEGIWTQSSFFENFEKFSGNNLGVQF